MNRNHRDGVLGGIYFLGFLGAFIYYLQHLPVGFGVGTILLNFIESLIWPAILVYRLFAFLHL